MNLKEKDLESLEQSKTVRFLDSLNLNYRNETYYKDDSVTIKPMLGVSYSNTTDTGMDINVNANFGIDDTSNPMVTEQGISISGAVGKLILRHKKQQGQEHPDIGGPGAQLVHVSGYNSDNSDNYLVAYSANKLGGLTISVISSNNIYSESALPAELAPFGLTQTNKEIMVSVSPILGLILGLAKGDMSVKPTRPNAIPELQTLLVAGGAGGFDKFMFTGDISTLSAKYTYGPIAMGIQSRKTPGVITTRANEEAAPVILPAVLKTSGFGVRYTMSDDIFFTYGQSKTNWEGFGDSNDQDSLRVGVYLNTNSVMSVEASYSSISNAGGSIGNNNKSFKAALSFALN